MIFPHTFLLRQCLICFLGWRKETSVLLCFSSHLYAFYRLDEKRSPYDLVWEDDTFLAGKVKSYFLFAIPFRL